MTDPMTPQRDVPREPLRDALFKLTNECSGALSMPGVREAIGNTNHSVLWMRVDEARAALAALAAPAAAPAAPECDCGTPERCPASAECVSMPAAPAPDAEWFSTNIVEQDGDAMIAALRAALEQMARKNATLREALQELLRVHTGPKLNDEGPSYRAVKAARSALGEP